MVRSGVRHPSGGSAGLLSKDAVLGHPCHDTFLHVKAVFGLLENCLCVFFEDFLTDFLPSVGGKTVKGDVPLGSTGQKSAVYLEGCLLYTSPRPRDS